MDTITVKAWDGNIALAGTDKDLVVIFHPGTIVNPIKSQDAGAPIFDQVHFMKVIHPGEPTQVYDQPVREQDKHRFREQWERYSKGQDQSVSGTPLSVLFPGKPEIVDSMRAIHIVTVQQLASLSDTATQNMIFGFNLRQRAQEYLSVAEKGAEFHQMQGKLEEYAAQVKELSEKLALIQAAPKPEPVKDQSSEIAELKAMMLALAAKPAPAQRGWPKGKPRKPRTEQPATAA